MNKKRTSGILAAGIIIAAAILNLRLNTQKEISSVSLFNIEALAEESDFDAEDWIDLYGSLTTIPCRSLSMPFQVFKGSSYLAVHYLNSLDNITVKIVGSGGQTVYLNNVNPVAGGQLVIALAGFAGGEYTIVFSSAAGGSICGEFEI
jgi:hypothetical protein